MKRKKNSRQRGSTTHGWGAMKKHRGAGNRGGRGNAGSGKRADQRKPAYWNNKVIMRAGQKPGQDYFGKHGFHSVTRTQVVALNVRQLDAQLPSLISSKHATKKGSAYSVDLSAIGFDKLLGSGRITQAVHVSVRAASPRAVEKISAAGGSVVLTGGQGTDVSDESAEDS
jgi:large subunit ribosomal protein L15